MALAIIAVLRRRRLMGAVDPGLVAQARAAVASVDGVRSVDALRIRWLGTDCAPR